MTRFLLAVIFLSFFFVGCGKNDGSLETGSAIITWQVGARGCEEANTPTIRVSLPFGLTNEEGVSSWMQSCASEEITIEHLQARYYVFTLEALTADGDVDFEGKSLQTQIRAGGVTELEPVILEASPATLTLQWNFGGPLCSQVGISEIEIFAFDQEGSLETQLSSSCELGEVTLTLDPGEYDVAINGLTVEDVLLYNHVFEINLGRGDRRSTQFEMQMVN